MSYYLFTARLSPRSTKSKEEYRMRTLFRATAFTILFAAALFLGACASDSTTTTTTPGAGVSGFSITCKVSSSTGIGVSGVGITMNGAVSKTGVTDSSGNYTFWDLPAGGYIITPTKSGQLVYPISQTINLSSNLTDVNFTSKPSSAATYFVTGTVTQSSVAVSNAVVVLGGDSAGTTMTNTNGQYIFSGLPNGNYTVSASKSGLSFAPQMSIANISGANLTGINFAGSVSTAQARYDVSGTVSYSGAKTGRIYVNLAYQGGGTSSFGTSITTPGAFTIRGVPQGNYTVTAFRDTIGNGEQNALFPAGNSSNFTVSSSNVTGVSVTLTDPVIPAPQTPTGLSVFPGSQTAIVFWDTVKIGNGPEAADSYKVFWSTNANFATNSTGTAIARDDAHFLVSGLTNGTGYYFMVKTVINAVESAPAVIGPVTINPTTGANTVSGTVTFPSVSGPMYVGVYSQSVGVFITRVQNPVSPQAYSISGVPNGSYFVFAIIDVNNNGQIDLGDVSNVGGNNGPDTMVTVNNANLSSSIALSGADGLATIRTNHWKGGSSEGYQLENLGVSAGRKLPVKTVLVSGPNVASAMDIGNGNGSNFNLDLGSVRPLIGDMYRFDVTYSDGTSETLYGTVQNVLDSFATFLSPSGSVPGQTTPTFSWSAPLNPPLAYSYGLWIGENSGNNDIWHYPKDDVMPSTTLSVLYNNDGNASQPTLTGGTVYNWAVMVRDDKMNSASYMVTFTP